MLTTWCSVLCSKDHVHASEGVAGVANRDNEVLDTHHADGYRQLAVSYLLSRPAHRLKIVRFERIRRGRKARISAAFFVDRAFGGDFVDLAFCDTRGPAWKTALEHYGSVR